MDSIRRRLFDMNMSARELDEACHSGRVFRKWSPARKVAMKHIFSAMKVLEGQLVVKWSDLDEEPPPAAAIRMPIEAYRLCWIAAPRALEQHALWRPSDIWGAIAKAVEFLGDAKWED
jgi:hypothetical protein